MRDHTIDEMRDRFGDDETEQYMVLAKATRSLVHLWELYVQAPVGSLAEAATGAALERMMQGMRDSPDHAAGMVESLLALVLHLRHGGTYEEWFLTLGLSPIPGESDDG